MQITGLTYNTSNNYNISSPQKNKPTFEGYVSAFSKRLDKVLKNKKCTFEDSIFLENELEKICRRRLTKNDILGEGTHAKVIKIDSKYVMRRVKNSIIGNFNYSFLQDQPWENLKTYYGRCVAMLGEVQILKNVSPTGEHIPAGIPQKIIKTSTPEECRKYYEDVYLPKFASLPQKAYDDIAWDCSELNLCYDGDDWYRFDVINPNNIVAVGKKLKIVDNITRKSDNIFHFPKTDNPSTKDFSMSLADLMRVFLAMQDVSTECEFSEKALPYRREIFKKVALAGIKNQLTVCNDNDKNRYFFKRVTKSLCQANKTPKTVEKALNKYVKMYSKDPKNVTTQASIYINKLFENNTDNIIHS